MIAITALLLPFIRLIINRRILLNIVQKMVSIKSNPRRVVNMSRDQLLELATDRLTSQIRSLMKELKLEFGSYDLHQLSPEIGLTEENLGSWSFTFLLGFKGRLSGLHQGLLEAKEGQLSEVPESCVSNVSVVSVVSAG